MSLGSLATIAAQRPPNLRIVALGAECYAETGRQRTHRAIGADLAAIAIACCMRNTCTVRQHDQLVVLRHDLHTSEEVVFAVVKIAPDEPPRVLPRDGPYLSHHLRAVLLGDEEALEG